MTMSEPTFAVPLSKLYQLNPIADWAGGGFSADCLLLGEHEFQNIPGAGFRSQAEAESAAIEHLAEVHNIYPAGEEAGRNG